MKKKKKNYRWQISLYVRISNPACTFRLPVPVSVAKVRQGTTGGRKMMVIAGRPYDLYLLLISTSQAFFSLFFSPSLLLSPFPHRLSFSISGCPFILTGFFFFFFLVIYNERLLTGVQVPNQHDLSLLSIRPVFYFVDKRLIFFMRAHVSFCFPWVNGLAYETESFRCTVRIFKWHILYVSAF